MSDNKVYVLSEPGGDVWGVFSEKLLVRSMYENLRRLSPLRCFRVDTVVLNTNLRIRSEDADQFCGPVEKEAEGGECVVPKEIRREVEKVKSRFSVFKEGMKVFRKMLEDRSLGLNEEKDQVPELFRDKYHIMRDIILKSVPEEDSFAYFSDRYVPEDVLKEAVAESS